MFCDSQALSLLQKQICLFLKQFLPSISDSWWDECVITALNVQQLSLVESHEFTQLEQLDLSALLRIFNKNFYELSKSKSIDRSVQALIKEAQNIRNRWAHQPADGIPTNDLYRDLDTVIRILSAIGSDKSTIDLVDEEKSKVLSSIVPSKFENNVTHTPENADDTADGFALGDLVQLISNSSVCGAIIAIRKNNNHELQYDVFHDNAIHQYYARQLCVNKTNTARETISPELLHANLSALQLKHPSIKNLYSLHASRINFIPYQFRPVLKLLNSDRPRLLIADEVGVGKTIEAGLIIKELQARRDIKSILIICPKPLVSDGKWVQELKRFDEQFEQVDGSTLRYCISEMDLEGEWPSRYRKAIIPYSILDEESLLGSSGKNRHKGLIQLDPPPIFDLVIVDEAHHIRNTNTWAYRNARYFCDNAEGVLLLSATPIQLGDDDLYNLLHLLRPDILPNKQVFEQMSEPNLYINKAITVANIAGEGWEKEVIENLTHVITRTRWGKNVLKADDRLQKIILLLDSDLTEPENRLTLIKALEDFHTFSPYINRTRRRIIGNFTTRKANTISVNFTPEQLRLHDEIIQFTASILAHKHGDNNLMFMLTTIRRQTASCVFGLAPMLEQMLKNQLNNIDLQDLGDDLLESLDDNNLPNKESWEINKYQDKIKDIITQARNLDREDPKFDAFYKVISDKQSMANNKVLVFSTFRHTLKYLIDRTSDISNLRVGLINGSVRDEERRNLRHRFSLEKENPNAIDILFSSEVGCEGLDFQFCDAIINYDLPWNPMRIEQRIGRIDRYGQKSETIVISNFITEQTIDADIYDRCLSRIGVFQQALGGSEEIFGHITREIKNIAENFTLTQKERDARLQQLADNEILKVQEQTKLENDQAQFFGLNPKFDDKKMIEQASSFWLSPTMLANMIAEYLLKKGATIPSGFGEKTISTLQLSKELRNELLVDFKKYEFTGEMAQVWMRYLKGNEAYLSLTFDSTTANDKRDLMFIHPVHPLTRQAMHEFNSTSQLISNLKITIDQLNEPVYPGSYPFAIYNWKMLGIKEDFSFEVIVKDDVLQKQFLHILGGAQHNHSAATQKYDEIKSELEAIHYTRWLSARANHIELVQQQVDVKIASLNTTHQARMATLEDQLANTQHEKIRRMKESQIASAIRDFERRRDELIQIPNKADINSKLLVIGTLTVE